MLVSVGVKVASTVGVCVGVAVLVPDGAVVVGVTVLVGVAVAVPAIDSAVGVPV